MNTFYLKVIACDRVFFEGKCQQVILPLFDGQQAIQAHHENMAFAVEVGEIRIQEENGNWIYGVTGTGFAQIINNRAMVLSIPVNIRRRSMSAVPKRQKSVQKSSSVRNRVSKSTICQRHLWRELWHV